MNLMKEAEPAKKAVVVEFDPLTKSITTMEDPESQVKQEDDSATPEDAVDNPVPLRLFTTCKTFDTLPQSSLSNPGIHINEAFMWNLFA